MREDVGRFSTVRGVDDSDTTTLLLESSFFFRLISSGGTERDSDVASTEVDGSSLLRLGMIGFSVVSDCDGSS
jgi:hypothetical protein